MSPRFVIAMATLAAAACSSAPDVEWMKVGQPYTTAEFRRDYAECEKTGKLSECLRSRGWVSVSAAPEPKQPTQEIRAPGGGVLPGGGSRRY